MPLEVRGNGMLRWCWEKECPNKLLHISDRNIICIDSSPGLGTDFGSTENHFWKSVFVVVHFWFEPFYVSPSFWMPVPLLHFPPQYHVITFDWIILFWQITIISRFKRIMPKWCQTNLWCFNQYHLYTFTINVMMVLLKWFWCVKSCLIQKRISAGGKPKFLSWKIWNGGKPIHKILRIWFSSWQPHLNTS